VRELSQKINFGETCQLLSNKFFVKNKIENIALKSRTLNENHSFKFFNVMPLGQEEVKRKKFLEVINIRIETFTIYSKCILVHVIYRYCIKAAHSDVYYVYFVNHIWTSLLS